MFYSALILFSFSLLNGSDSVTTVVEPSMLFCETVMAPQQIILFRIRQRAGRMGFMIAYMNFQADETHPNRARWFVIIQTAIIVASGAQDRFGKGPEQPLLKQAEAGAWPPLPVDAPGGWIHACI